MPKYVYKIGKVTDIGNNNQVNCQGLQLADDRIVSNDIGNITMYLVECNCRLCSTCVASHGEEVFYVRNARLRSMLGLLDHALKVAYPGCPESLPKGLSSSLGDSHPEPIRLCKYWEMVYKIGGLGVHSKCWIWRLTGV